MGKVQLTSVTVPASSYLLTSLVNVHLRLAIPATDTSKDALLTDLIARASQAVITHCRQPFVIETLQDVIIPDRDPYPYQVPGGLQPLQLARWPLVSVISVTITPMVNSPIVLNQGTDFIVDNARGELIRLNPDTGYTWRWDAVPTTVVYQAGYNPVPSDLEDAVIRLVTKAYWNAGRDPSLMEESQGSIGTKRYWVAGPNAEGNLPPEIADLLDAYRVPTVR
jgi:hypothetical protein